MQDWLRSQPRWALILFLAALIAVTVWLLNRVFRRTAPDGAPNRSGDGTSWADSPRYLRDFRKLCLRLGCPVEHGDTVRQLLARLGSLGHDVSPLTAMERYHYAVRYAGAPPQPAEEKAFRRTIRRLR